VLELTEHFSAAKGGIASKLAINKLLSNLVWDGSNINELITYIDYLSLLASDPTRGVDEDLKAQYLIGAI